MQVVHQSGRYSVQVLGVGMIPGNKSEVRRGLNWVIVGRVWGAFGIFKRVRPVVVDLGYYRTEETARAVLKHVIMSLRLAHKVFEMPADKFADSSEEPGGANELIKE